MIVFHILNPESWILYPSATGKPFDGFDELTAGRLRTSGQTGRRADGSRADGPVGKQMSDVRGQMTDDRRQRADDR